MRHQQAILLVSISMQTANYLFCYLTIGVMKSSLSQDLGQSFLTWETLSYHIWTCRFWLNCFLVLSYVNILRHALLACQVQKKHTQAPHRDVLTCGGVVFQNQYSRCINCPPLENELIFRILIFSYPPLDWFKHPKTKGLPRTRIWHLSEGVMIFLEQNAYLGPIMAGKHCFPISPKGSKAPKSTDLRGQAKFKMLTSFWRPCVSRQWSK